MSQSSPTGRVLLLCADEQVRHVAAIMLRVLGGYDVLPVSNALQALTRVRSYRPDLLLLDASASRVTYPATLSALGVRTGGVPLLFFTCETRAEELDALRSLGAHDVVIMPFASNYLLGRVAEALAHDKAAA
jgi:CheY-like chemotaxis protein